MDSIETDGSEKITRKSFKIIASYNETIEKENRTNVK